jgi:thioredoxin 1
MPGEIVKMKLIASLLVICLALSLGPALAQIMGNYPSQMGNVYTQGNTYTDKDNFEVNLENNNIVKITQLEQINTFLYKGPVFVEMGYESCRPCQAMKPILEKLAVEYQGKATIAFIDIHQSPGLAKYFGISNHTPDSFVIVGTENGKYVYISDEGKINMDRSQARIIGLGDKNEQIFKKIVDLAIVQQDKSKST